MAGLTPDVNQQPHWGGIHTIYLDNAATTRPFPCVAEAVQRSLLEGYLNPSAAYGPALAVEKQMLACRDALREALHAPGYDVIFTSGGTESDGLALLGSTLRSERKQRILLSAVEHPAVHETCAHLQKLGHEVEVIPVDALGVPRMEAFADLLGKPVDLLSVMQVCNETGSVAPLGEMIRRTNALHPKARVHVDGVQGFLRLPTDLSALTVDLYTLSAHKIHGPKGIGALLVKRGLPLAPQHLGGGQEGGLRSGTENTPGIAGLLAAVREMRTRQGEIDGLRDKKAALYGGLLSGAKELVLNGAPPDSASGAPHILNVSFPGVRGEVMLHALEARGILVSTGAACSARRKKTNRVLAAMGKSAEMQEGAIRFSLSVENTIEEMQEVAAIAVPDYQTW